MQHVRSLTGVRVRGAWLTIGSFDGVHLGHQAIIRALVSGAHQAGVPAVVLTFHPHPSVVLGKRQTANYLTTPEQRASILQGLGVDLLVTHPFDRAVSNQSAQQFLQVLMDHLGFRRLWVGHDFAMGHNREGDVQALRSLGEELGYQLEVVPPVYLGDELVSSSRIRALLAGGNVAHAARLLGRPYQLDGVVIQGEGRGKSLGIPTANLEIEKDRALPGIGVYACQAIIGAETWGAVTNIGVRPTFTNPANQVQVEAHLLDFDSDLYHQRLQLEFIGHLRGEQRFPTPQALVEQVQADIARARRLLNQI